MVLQDIMQEALQQGLTGSAPGSGVDSARALGASANRIQVFETRQMLIRQRYGVIRSHPF